MKKMSSCSTLDSVKSGINRKSSKRYAGDFKECITCSLCSGYLRSAVTITLCLHSFCRECLTRHLRKSRACPKCRCLIHPVKPSTNIRSDLVLQRLVYKMLPGLFEIELERRKKQVLASSESSQGTAQGKSKTQMFDRGSAIFTGYENISICLQHRPSSIIQDDKETMHDLGPRYLLCPSRLTVEILKRFIENKFCLSQRMEVNIFYLDHLLLDDYKMIDVAYIYRWDQVNPMMLSYSILQLNPTASVVEYTSAVTTQHCSRKSIGGKEPFPESSASAAQPDSDATAAPYSSSPGSRAALTTVSSSNTIADAVGEADHCSLAGVKADQCHSTSEFSGRKRGRKRKKSKRHSTSPSPVTKRFCVRDDGPGIVKTFLSVKDGRGGSRSPPESPGTGSVLSAQNPESSGVSCVETSVPFVSVSTEADRVQNLDSVDSSASKMIQSACEDSASVTTCSSISQSNAVHKDRVLDRQNCAAFEGTNESRPIIASETVVEGISLSTDGVESTLGLVNGPDGDIVGAEDVSTAKNDRTLEPDDAKTLASGGEKEPNSGVSSVSSVSGIRPVSLHSDIINTVSSTLETKTVHDSTRLRGPDIPHVLKTLLATLPKDKTQFLEADSSMLPSPPCTSGIYGPPISCSQRANGLCETVSNDKLKDTVVCPQCGGKAGFVDGTSVTSTSSSIKCHNCLSFNTSIMLFINHGQVPCDEPHERSCTSQVPIPHVGDPGGGSVDKGEDIPADIVPKLECFDNDLVSTGLSCGLGSQQSHPSSSLSGLSTITRRQCQPPADPNNLSGLETKTMSQSGHQPIAPSEASPSRDVHPSADDSPLAASGSAAGSSGDRCPAVAASNAPLTGNKCGRKQKSLESIIRQLQPRQMSPAAVGAGSLKLSPKASLSPSNNRKPVIHETPVSTPPADKVQSIVEDRLVLRSNVEGQGRSSWSTENQSLLRRALTMPGRNLQTPTGRFPKPEERLHTAPSGNQSPYSFTAPPIKRLKNMFEGLEASGYASLLNGPVSRGENRRLPQCVPTTSASALTIRDTRVMGLNRLPTLPESAFQNNHPCVSMNRRYPTMAVTSANGFDAPLELTTKESRDRKWRETAKKLDGDVLRTSFPLFDNRR